jgi:hypothetical protein
MSDRFVPVALAALLASVVICGAGCAAEPGVEAPPARSPLQPRHAAVQREPSVGHPPVREERSTHPLIGLVASDDPVITAALASGARLALAESRSSGGPDLQLLVGERESHWASAAGAAVRMAMDEGAIAVIAPPERRRAHAIAQFGTRAGVPIVSTSPASSVTQAGSTWVVSVVSASPSAARLTDSSRSAPDCAPDRWRAAGYDAGRAVVEAVRRNGMRREGLTKSLAGGEPFAGATGSIVIEMSGARRDP